MNDYTSTCGIKYVNFIASYVQHVYYALTVFEEFKQAFMWFCDNIAMIIFLEASRIHNWSTTASDFDNVQWGLRYNQLKNKKTINSLSTINPANSEIHRLLL